tara:strand:+ start:1694 stop:2044 length:351 start_codon:yes stop_codon:yes gene_type:complete
MALSGAKYEMAGLGQFGSIYTTDVTAIVPPADYIIAGIQFIEDSTFTALTVENNTVDSRVYPNTVNAANNSGAGSEGTGGQVLDGTTFSAGITIFGRWTGLTLATGTVIAYLAPKH